MPYTDGVLTVMHRSLAVKTGLFENKLKSLCCLIPSSVIYIYTSVDEGVCIVNELGLSVFIFE